MSFWTKESLSLSQAESGISMMGDGRLCPRSRGAARSTVPYDARPPSTRKKLGEGGGGWSKRELRIENCVFTCCRMSIMAFELPIMEMDFALKVIPLKLFYYQTFFETWRNEHS